MPDNKDIILNEIPKDKVLSKAADEHAYLANFCYQRQLSIEHTIMNTIQYHGYSDITLADVQAALAEYPTVKNNSAVLKEEEVKLKSISTKDARKLILDILSEKGAIANSTIMMSEFFKKNVMMNQNSIKQLLTIMSSDTERLIINDKKNGGWQLLKHEN